MSQFQNFLHTHGPGLDCKKVNEESIQDFGQRLPDSLISLWKEAGWCGYGRGLIWFVDPQAFQGLLKEWKAPRDGVVFGRTAFADLMVVIKGQVNYLYAQSGRMVNLELPVEDYVNITLTLKFYISETLLSDEFNSALKRLGPISPSECYGFEPLPALGGSGKAETIRKVKLMEYLAILGQVR